MHSKDLPTNKLYLQGHASNMQHLSVNIRYLDTGFRFDLCSNISLQFNVNGLITEQPGSLSANLRFCGGEEDISSTSV